MENLNLKIEEGTIINVKYTEFGRIYLVKKENNETKIITRYYDRVSDFMSREYGSSEEYTKDKVIYLISDEDRLLALKNEKDSIIFISDKINETYETITQYGNTDYISNTYGLTEEEFIKIVREELNSKKLKLNN